MATMKWRAKLSTTWSDMASVKPSSSSAVTSGFKPGSAPVIETVRIMAPNTSQGGVSSSPRSLRPGQPAAAHQAVIDRNRIRPVDGDGGFRLRVGGERIGQRRHAGIEGAPRLPQRLVRFQHHGEFGEIEAPDIDQRAGALLGRDRCRMREGVAQFAQAHQRERRRQRQFRRQRASPRLQRHWLLLSLFEYL